MPGALVSTTRVRKIEYLKGPGLTIVKIILILKQKHMNVGVHSSVDSEDARGRQDLKDVGSILSKAFFLYLFGKSKNDGGTSLFGRFH